MRRCEVIFSGMVQGVGFRYSAQRRAQALGLSGFVRNLPDGRVEMVAQGEAEGLQELLGYLEANFSIRDKTVCDVPPRDDMKDFAITR